MWRLRVPGTIPGVPRPALGFSGRRLMREFSFLAVILGIVIGALLAAANAFVGLRVGMTISASIPAAVMSILVLKRLLKRGTILESNIVQTVGSAGESLAGGMIFTVPALFIMGSDPTYWEMVIWGTIGGMLGVCFMVPLRQVLIVREHGVLPFPEGVACAEVLHSGERGGASARPVILGTVVGGLYFLLTELRFWADTGTVSLKRFYTEAQLNASAALLGVGYILGARVSAYMLSGALMAWFLIIPAIGFFGATAAAPLLPATDKTISEMSPGDIWSNYVRFIGAGAVAVGGLISLFKSLPTIGSSFWHVLTGIFRRSGRRLESTERDVPLILLPLVIAGLGYAMWRFPQVRVDHIGVLAVLIAAFFFVTVSSRLVGIIGASSNPLSGMTIATLLGASLIYKFFVLDRAEPGDGVTVAGLQITCISVGAIVAIAIAVAGDTSQDLKTGFLVKATPYKQQLGKTIGVLTSVLAVAGIVLLLNHTYGFGEKTTEKPFPMLAPQANIMKILVQSVFGGDMPWTLIFIGGSAAVVIELLGLPSLPVAVGLYLPMGVSTPLIFGGVVRWLVDRRSAEKSDHDPGVLTASGMVAGEGLMGVAIAGVTALIAATSSSVFANPLADVPGTSEPINPRHFVPWLWASLGVLPTKWGLTDAWWNALPLFPFVLLTIWLWWCARQPPPIMLPPSAPTPGPSAPPRHTLQPIPPMTSRSGQGITGSATAPEPSGHVAPRYRASAVRSPLPAPPAASPPPEGDEPAEGGAASDEDRSPSAADVTATETPTASQPPIVRPDPPGFADTGSPPSSVLFPTPPAEPDANETTEDDPPKYPPSPTDAAGA